jgi:hypothetical protein
MAFKSKSKRRKYNKEWKNKNKTKQKEYNAKWKAKLKEWYFNYKSSSPCVICGESRAVVLESHHMEPKNKSFTLYEGVASGISIRRLEIEATKCIILCANHHRLHHKNAFNEDEQKIWDEKVKLFEANKGTHFFGQPEVKKVLTRSKKKILPHINEDGTIQ